jgi:hypothetical protein
MDPNRFYGEMMDYTQSLFCAFNPLDRNKASLITFASSITIQIPLAEYTAARWFELIDVLRSTPNVCCSCCTPTATAFLVAKSVFDATPPSPETLPIIFVVTDGAPWQNTAGPFSWPALDAAVYTWTTVPQQSQILQNTYNARVMMVGVPNKFGDSPRTDYFQGIPDPSKSPAGKPASYQCISRGSQTTCNNMRSPPFPIVSTPIDKNLFSSNSWDVQSLLDLTLTALCEILPTPAPTRRPTTLAPTKAPVVAPTPPPTRAPTANPTRPPTRNPTMQPTSSKPTFNPTFAPSQNPTASPVKPELDGLDMYFIIDRSRSMRWVPDLCRSAPGGNPNDNDSVACWRLFLDFISNIVEQTAAIPYRDSRLGWKDFFPNDIKRGIRVWLYAFACTGRQSEPVVITIGEALTSREAFQNALAIADKMIPDGGTCPGAAIEKAAAKVQGSDLLTRIFKTAILLTDGVFYDMPRPKNAAKGLFHFGVLTYSLGISIPGDGETFGLTPDEIKIQRNQLLYFVQNQEARLYNFGVNGLNLLDEIAQEFVDQLPYDAVANLPDVAAVPYFCGWTSKARCTEMNESQTATGVYCKWDSNKRVCLSKDSCKFPRKQCVGPYCKWSSNKCRAVPGMMPA